MFSDEKIQNVHLYFLPPGLQDTKASDGWGAPGPGENTDSEDYVILNRYILLTLLDSED